MKEIREDLEAIAMKLYKLENLAKLMEDYFYDVTSDENFSKHQTLSEVLVEKIKDIDKDNQNLITKIFKKEREK